MTKAPNASASHTSTSQATRFGVIDLGTNNCRLLIADAGTGRNRAGGRNAARGRAGRNARGQSLGFRTVDTYSNVVRLGEGLSRTGQLGEAAMDRTLHALRTCAKRVRSFGVEQVRAVATEACRRATNAPEFVERVRTETGLQLEVISGQEEAELGLHACAPLLKGRFGHALVYDIGGGSTELSFLSVHAPGQFELLASASLPYGVVTLAEDPNALYPDIVRSVSARVMDLPFYEEVKAQLRAGDVQFLGMSSTVTTLSALAKGLKRYDRAQVDGSRLTRHEMQRQVHRLRAAEAGPQTLSSTVGLDRADLVLPGCAVLEGLRAALPFRATDVADRGLREGMLVTLMSAQAASASGQLSAQAS